MDIATRLKNARPKQAEAMADELYPSVAQIISDRAKAESRAEITAALALAQAKVLIVESERDMAKEHHKTLLRSMDELKAQIVSLNQELTRHKAAMLNMEEDSEESEKEHEAKMGAAELRIRQLEKDNAELRGRLSVPMPDPVQVPNFRFDVERDRTGKITNVTAIPIGVN